MVIGNKIFEDNNKTYIMGILNVTPDSFYDGGKYDTVDNALFRAEEIIRDGADIIDIGGESTRPGYSPVDETEELKRILPVISAVVNKFDIPVSVDTFHSKTASEAVDCGASLVNDIWGLRYAGNTVPMAEVIKEKNASVCIMNNSSDINDLKMSIEIAKKAGISQDRIMTDPGVGFSKDYETNMKVIANLSVFKELGFPVLLGTSNKSVIGLTLDLPVNERLEGTLATTAFAIINNCSFVRVHDVKSNRRFIDMAEAILKYKM